MCVCVGGVIGDKNGGKTLKKGHRNRKIDADNQNKNENCSIFN